MESEERAPDPDLVDEEAEAAKADAPDDDVVRAEEAAAAEQAGRIGGAGGADEVTDEAERPLAEAGQGEAEGFELAERELIENATDMGGGNPLEDEFAGDDPRADAAHGEADQVDSTETGADTAGTEIEDS